MVLGGYAPFGALPRALCLSVPPALPGEPLDASLDDPVLREEVELLIRMMVAVNASEDPLDQVAIDRALFDVN